MNKQIIIIVVALLILALVGVVLFGMKRKKENYSGNSPAFDPTTRGGVAGIGPSPKENTEGFCGSCA